MGNLPKGYKDPEKYIAYLERQREYKRIKRANHYKGNEDLYRDRNLQRNYGISLGDYQDMWETQNGLCKICKNPETATYKGTLKFLVVDHCHTSGEIRGLLCNNCNRAIGMLKDNPEVLRNAASYLEGN